MKAWFNVLRIVTVLNTRSFHIFTFYLAGDRKGTWLISGFSTGSNSFPPIIIERLDLMVSILRVLGCIWVLKPTNLIEGGSQFSSVSPVSV